MAKNGSQHLLSTMCWTSQRTGLVERGFRHVIRYRNQSNLITGQSARSATPARKTITFAVNYYPGLSKGHAAISVTDARTFEENAIRGVTGVYSISHVNKTEECFVIASNGLLGSQGCALWIKKKNRSNEHSDCINAFNETCKGYETSVYRYNPTICHPPKKKIMNKADGCF
ncbi:uncharacterized protein LOC144100551 [Amblyomma americanum]